MYCFIVFVSGKLDETAIINCDIVIYIMLITNIILIIFWTLSKNPFLNSYFYYFKTSQKSSINLNDKIDHVKFFTRCIWHLLGCCLETSLDLIPRWSWLWELSCNIRYCNMRFVHNKGRKVTVQIKWIKQLYVVNILLWKQVFDFYDNITDFLDIMNLTVPDKERDA